MASNKIGLKVSLVEIDSIHIEFRSYSQTFSTISFVKYRNSVPIEIMEHLPLKNYSNKYPKWFIPHNRNQVSLLSLTFQKPASTEFLDRSKLASTRSRIGTQYRFFNLDTENPRARGSLSKYRISLSLFLLTIHFNGNNGDKEEEGGGGGGGHQGHEIYARNANRNRAYDHRRLSGLVYVGREGGREGMVIRMSRDERGNKRCPRQPRDSSHGGFINTTRARFLRARNAARLITIIYNNTDLSTAFFILFSPAKDRCSTSKVLSFAFLHCSFVTKGSAKKRSQLFRNSKLVVSQEGRRKETTIFLLNRSVIGENIVENCSILHRRFNFSISWKRIYRRKISSYPNDSLKFHRIF